MAKSISQSFICIIAFFLVLTLFLASDSQAQEIFDNSAFDPVVSASNPFPGFGEGDCRFYEEGLGKESCIRFCEQYDCDETDYSGPGVYNSQVRRACIRLLKRYDQATDIAGPPCFCEPVCDFKLNKCLNNCDPDDRCCPTNCGNANLRCETNCCQQQQDLNRNICLENCGGDPVCEQACPMLFCASLTLICPPPGPLP